MARGAKVDRPDAMKMRPVAGPRSERTECPRCHSSVRASSLVANVLGIRICFDCATAVRTTLASIGEAIGQRDDHYRRKYGISARDYRERFIAQIGLCAICARRQEDFGTLFVVDHNHGNGEVRGLLCGTCNTALGLFGDSPAVLLNAISYLTERGSSPRQRAAPSPEKPS